MVLFKRIIRKVTLSENFELNRVLANGFLFGTFSFDHHRQRKSTPLKSRMQTCRWFLLLLCFATTSNSKKRSRFFVLPGKFCEVFNFNGLTV